MIPVVWNENSINNKINFKKSIIFDVVTAKGQLGGSYNQVRLERVYNWRRSLY